MEQHLHQGCGFDSDLLGEVGQGGTPAKPHGLPVPLAEPHATDGGGLHLVEFLPALLLGLAPAPAARTTTAEGTLSTAAATTWPAHRWPTETAAAGPSLRAGTATS